MNREELEKKAKAAMAAAGDMAAQGVEWVKNYRETHRETAPDAVAHDGDRRIYGVENLAPQSTGFRAFNAFRLMLAPLLIRIIWIVGAYIVYPIVMYNIFATRSKYQYYTSASDTWEIVWRSIVILILFRLVLEIFMALFRIHESTTKMNELMGRLVSLEEGRKQAEEKGDGNV